MFRRPDTKDAVLGAELVLPEEELTTVRLVPVEPLLLLMKPGLLPSSTMIEGGATAPPPVVVGLEEEDTTLILDGGNFGALSVIGGGRFLPGGFAGAGC